MKVFIKHILILQDLKYIADVAEVTYIVVKKNIYIFFILYNKYTVYSKYIISNII